MLPYIDIPFRYAGSLTGASVDELKLIASFLLSYPLAGVLKRISDAKPNRKNLFIVAVSLFYLIGLFDLWSGIRTLLISSIGAYAIANYVKGPFMPWIGFIFLMGHMSINQLHRQRFNADGRVDITGAQMVLVMKLTAFCWNVYDGRLPEDSLVDFQKDRAIHQMPTFLDFAGYVLFFPSLFAGPSFDYVEYRRWIKTTMFEFPAETDPSMRPRTRKKRKIPQSSTPAMIKAIIGLAWIFLFVKLSVWYNVERVLGSEYKQHGLIRRIFILYMLGFTSRLKYYGVWYLTEGACILSGMGYKGVDLQTGRVQWDRLQNVNPWGIETAQNARAYLGNWNMNTNNWLRNYMYLRVTRKGKKPGFRASMATFITSAIWHGFYPGYYLSFLLAAFLQTAAKDFRRYVRPFFLTPDGQRPTQYKPYYDALSFLTTQLVFSFTTAPFVLLSLQSSLQVWARVYFYAIFGTAAVLVFFASPAKPWLVQQLKVRNRDQEVKFMPKGSSSSSSSVKVKHSQLLGLPKHPGRDMDEVVKEIREEVQARRRRGVSVNTPAGIKGKE